MKSLIRFFLLAGVFLGLFGQGIAVASTPCAMMAAQQMASASDQMANCPDCEEGSDKNKSSHEPPPCCANMTGVGSIALTDIQSFKAAPFAAERSAHLWALAPVLAGREIPPEHGPPLFLG